MIEAFMLVNRSVAWFAETRAASHGPAGLKMPTGLHEASVVASWTN